MSSLSMTPEGDPDLTTYLNELLRTNKPEQQNNTFWFPTPENAGKLEDYTLIPTRILTELPELKKKEKPNPQEDIECKTICLERFDWTNTLLREAGKQAIEGIVVEYLDIFDRHRMDI